MGNENQSLREIEISGGYLGITSKGRNFKKENI